MTTSAIDRRVGTAALVLTIGGVVVPGTEHGGAVIRGGRADTDRRPEPATLTVDVDVDALPELPTIGVPVDLELGADAIAYFGLAGDELDAARWRFRGTVTDPAVTAAGVVSITATGRRAQLGRRRIGDEPWPAESDGARAARILALAGATGLTSWEYAGAAPDGWFDQFLGTPTNVTLTADPTGLRVTFGARAIGAGPPYTWRNATGLTVGKRYTVLAEVYVPPGQPRMALASPFGGGIGESVAIPAADRWQTAVYQFDAGSGAELVALTPDTFFTGNPAGVYCLVRRFVVYESDAAIVGRLDPGTVAVLARDVDRRYALELLDALAVDAQAELVELRDGRLEWHDAQHRIDGDPVVELAADQVLDDLVWTQTLAALVNDLEVAYGEPDVDGNRASVRVVDQASVDDPNIGPNEAALDSQLAAEVDAQTLAVTTVGRRSRPVWQLDGLVVDLLRSVDQATARKLLGLAFGDLLAVAGQPASAPLRSGRLWVEGWTETITRKAWRLALDVSDYGASGPAITWADVDPAITWADVPTDVSWLGATSWRPPAPTAGRWLDAPAGLRWTDADPAATWLTYTD